MRTIFRTALYVEQIRAIPEKFDRTHERITNLESALQQSCDGYPGVIGKDINYFRIVGGFPGVAPVLIFFHHDDHRIVMLKAEVQVNYEEESE